VGVARSFTEEESKMNPPKRIYMTEGNHGRSFDTEKTNIDNISNENYLGGGPYTIFTYTLEEEEPMTYTEPDPTPTQAAIEEIFNKRLFGGKPMEPKKEMTGLEALAYMATGGWFLLNNKGDRPYQLNKAGHLMFREDVNVMRYSTGDAMLVMREGITPCPDPSKPEVKVDEYNESRLAIVNLDAVGARFAEEILTHIDRFFQRKEPKS